jgi:hypothetical protein
MQRIENQLQSLLRIQTKTSMELEHMKSSTIVHSSQNKHLLLPFNKGFEAEGAKQKAENFKSYY